MSKRRPKKKEPEVLTRLEDLDWIYDEIQKLISSLMTPKGQSALSDEAADTISAAILAKNWPCDPSRSSVQMKGRRIRGEWHLSVREQELMFLLHEAARRGFNRAAGAFAQLLKNYLVEVGKQKTLLEKRRTNGVRVSRLGRQYSKPLSDARAERVCKLFRSVRGSSRSVAEALKKVSEKIGPLYDRETDMSTKAIRKILKRNGVEITVGNF